MTKRLLASLLAVLMVVSMIPLTAFAAVPTDVGTLTKAGEGTWNSTQKTYTISVESSETNAITALGANPVVYEEKESELSKVTDVTAAYTAGADSAPGTLVLTFTTLPTAKFTYYVGTPTDDGGTQVAPVKHVKLTDIPAPITEVNITIDDECEAGAGKTFPTAEVTTVPMVPAQSDGGKETAAVTVTAAWVDGENAEAQEPTTAGTYTATFTLGEAADGYVLADDAIVKVNDTAVAEDAELTATVTAKAALAAENFTVKAGSEAIPVNKQLAYKAGGYAITTEVKDITLTGFTTKIYSVGDEGVETAVTGTTITDVGTYKVKVEFTGNETYLATEEGGLTVDTIEIQAVALTATPALKDETKVVTKVYDKAVTIPTTVNLKEYFKVDFKDGENQAVTLNDDDYTLTAEYAAAAAAEKVAVKVTVTLSDDAKKKYSLSNTEATSVADAGKITAKEVTVSGVWSGTDLTYTGSALTAPTYTLSANTDALTLGEISVYATDERGDKTGVALTGDNFKNAGNYIVEATVTAKTNYAITDHPDGQTIPQPFNVKPITITGVNITATASNAETGIATGDTVTATVSPTVEDGTVSYEWYNGTTKIDGETGKTYTIGDGKTGTISVKIALADENDKNHVIDTGADTSNEITIGSKPLSAEKVTLSQESYTFTKNGTYVPTVTVKYGESDTALTVETDYTVEITDNEHAGTATVTVTGVGSYTGVVTKTFTIAQGTPAVTPNEVASLKMGGTETKEYTVEADGTIIATSFDDSVATAVVKGDKVTVTAHKAGNATITVKTVNGTDYSALNKEISVTVAAADPNAPSVSPTSVSVKAGKTTTATVTGGTIGSVSSADETVATATFSGQTVTIKGVKAGGPVNITIATAEGNGYSAGSLTVAVTVTSGGPTIDPGPGPSTSPSPTPVPTPEPPKATVEPDVDGGVASGKVDSDTIGDLITEAGDKGAGEVVVEVKPEAGTEVTEVKTELPAESMKDLADAKVDLTVSTPVADVTLPQESLKELGAGEGAVTVTAAQTGDENSATITVTVEQGDKAVETGVTATVPSNVVSTMAGADNGTVTVSTPVADVVLPNSTLVAAGKNDVSVSAIPTANGTAIEVKSNGVTMNKSDILVAVPAADADDNTVAYIVDANGNKTILPKSAAVEGEMKILLDTGKATITYGSNAKTFADNDSIPNYAKAAFTTSRELITGIKGSDGKMNFKPNKVTTRAELVTMLHRLESKPNGGDVDFDDMKGNEWYKEAAAWAQSTGVVTGTDTGFSGNKNISRQELATMLYRYMNNVTGYKGATGDFSGIAGGDKVSKWASEAMKWAYGSGILTGKANSAGEVNLDPTGMATRAEVSAMLERFVKLIAG